MCLPYTQPSCPLTISFAAAPAVTRQRFPTLSIVPYRHEIREFSFSWRVSSHAIPLFAIKKQSHLTWSDQDKPAPSGPMSAISRFVVSCGLRLSGVVLGEIPKRRVARSGFSSGGDKGQ